MRACDTPKHRRLKKMLGINGGYEYCLQKAEEAWTMKEYLDEKIEGTFGIGYATYTLKETTLSGAKAEDWEGEHTFPLRTVYESFKAMEKD